VKGVRPDSSKAAPGRTASYSATALENPRPSITATSAEKPKSRPYATLKSRAINAVWKTRFPTSRR
jgi:hypothetical protein